MAVELVNCKCGSCRLNASEFKLDKSDRLFVDFSRAFFK